MTSAELEPLGIGPRDAEQLKDALAAVISPIGEGSVYTQVGPDQRTSTASGPSPS
jgi:hypothetical protein